LREDSAAKEGIGLPMRPSYEKETNKSQGTPVEKIEKG
jgi:hypothetical protein